MISSKRKQIILAPGSIWFEEKPERYLAFNPRQNKPKILSGDREISVKKIPENFTAKEAFYFWTAKTILYEFASAKRLPAGLNSHLKAYHRKIKDPAKQFEFAEITASHLFRKSHPGLNNLSYGQKLFDTLFKKSFIPIRGNILDIGAGLGIHTRDFLDRFKEKVAGITRKIRYISVDLSSKLLEAQRVANNSKVMPHAFIQANALRLPFSNKVFDLILANEIIADFPVAKCIKNQPSTFRHFAKQYGLYFDDAPSEFLLNSGALSFLSELHRVLKIKGIAVIIEYGQDWGYPTATKLKGHTEYSIHFGHLITAAKKIGFKVEYQDLLHFLGFNPNVKVITGNTFSLLQKLLKRLNLKIDIFAYTPGMLKQELPDLYPKIHNLQFEKLAKLAVSLKLQDFKVLILRK